MKGKCFQIHCLQNLFIGKEFVIVYVVCMEMWNLYIQQQTLGTFLTFYETEIGHEY